MSQQELGLGRGEGSTFPKGPPFYISTLASPCKNLIGLYSVVESQHVCQILLYFSMLLFGNYEIVI